MGEGGKGERHNRYHFDSSSITVPGGRRRHFWHSSLSHCAHTSAASTAAAIARHFCYCPSSTSPPRARLAWQDGGEGLRQCGPARALRNFHTL